MGYAVELALAGAGLGLGTGVAGDGLGEGLGAGDGPAIPAAITKQSPMVSVSVSCNQLD